MLRYMSFAYRAKEFAHQMSSPSGGPALTRNKINIIQHSVVRKWVPLWTGPPVAFILSADNDHHHLLTSQ